MKNGNGLSMALLRASLILSAIAFMACGSSTPEVTPPDAQILCTTEGGEACPITSTETASTTTTVTVTKTETNTDTVTNTATNTGTTTAVSTFVYSEACNHSAKGTVTGLAADGQSGFWTVTTIGQPDWNLCITKSKSLGSGGTDTRVAGYAYLASELGQANPPSLVRYEGVMAAKCVMVSPVSASSLGPDVLGSTVKLDGLGGAIITDGITTATWTQALQGTGKCTFETPANPSW